MNNDANFHDEWLAENGWKEGRIAPHLDRHNRTWFRFAMTPTKCACNDDRRGIQFQLKQWDHTRYEGGGIGWELCIVSETQGDEQWINFAVYSISNESFRDVIDAQQAKLLRAWEAANQAK